MTKPSWRPFKPWRTATMSPGCDSRQMNSFKKAPALLTVMYSFSGSADRVVVERDMSG